MRIDKAGKLVVPESSIESACTTLLQLDGWRAFKMEQNFSERKVKVIGEKGMADHLYIRYGQHSIFDAHLASVLWIEWKSAKGLLASHQKLWHAAERKRGALTLIAGEDFPASIEGFQNWYKNSGLQRRGM